MVRFSVHGHTGLRVSQDSPGSAGKPMRFKPIPPQITRLVLLTVGIVVAYCTARYFLTPASFGELGWYRANALGEQAAHARVYGGKASCDECHPDQLETLGKFEHKSLSCEGCHGPGQAHAEEPDAHRMAVLSYSHCVRCHEANPSRPKWHKQVDPKDHYAGSYCTECHLPHHPAEAPQ